MYSPPAPVLELFFRPFGADSFPTLTHGLRRGLHSCTASRFVNLELVCRCGRPW